MKKVKNRELEKKVEKHMQKTKNMKQVNSKVNDMFFPGAAGIDQQGEVSAQKKI